MTHEKLRHSQQCVYKYMRVHSCSMTVSVVSKIEPDAAIDCC